MIQLSRDETAEKVNEVHNAITLSEVIDASWLRELELRRCLKERMQSLSESYEKLKEQDVAMNVMAQEERELDSERKKHSVELSNVSQGVLRYRSKFEETGHHLNTFATGLGFVKQTDSPGNVLSSLAEQMRCSFNELRRVNAGLEEKLVLTGVSKQKVMMELKAILVDLRSSCSQNPVRHKQSHEEALADLNLGSHVLKDMNSVWRASLPTVPALSGESSHSELLTFLSVSLGHFAEECVNDMADLSLTWRSSSQCASERLREEAKLVGILSVETHRYRSISGALKSAIKDAELLLDSTSFESVAHAISHACKLMQQRLGCACVAYWAKQESEFFGYSSFGPNEVFRFVVTEGSRNPLFAVSSSATYSVDETELPPDIDCLLRKQGENVNVTAFSVTGSSGGLTVIRRESDAPFPPFSGIYCEQFFRRIVSAVRPLQMVLNRRIADQRPLELDSHAQIPHVL
jgi:hypothetical protein